MIAEQTLQRLSHGGVAVQGQQQSGISVAIQHLTHAGGDLLQSIPPVLAAMHGRQNHPLALPVQTIEPGF